MADNKVFRLHEGSDGIGWFNSSPFTSEQIRTVKTNLRDIPTSIPSPYAQIELVKSAFRWLSQTGDVDGDTAYHKLVSYALDVAQLFFAIDKYNDFKVVAWHPTDRFKALIENSLTEKHKKLASTLQLFWEQDSLPVNGNHDKQLYNFEYTKRLYFLLNKSNQIIGATSPITLFMPAPDINEVTKDFNIIIGTHKLFGDKYSSLAERNRDFIKYIFLLAETDNFKILFKEFNDYLEKIKKLLPSDLIDEIANGDTKVADLPELTVLNNSGDICEVNGIKLHKNKKIANDTIQTTSDFVIKPDFKIAETLPLVLPNEKFTRQWTYTTEGILWHENYVVPEKNLNPLDESVLPIVNDVYPWLSIGNFLEDKVFKLPYPIDSNSYFTGGANQFLLPLTETFYKYFDVSKIQEYVHIEELSAGYKIKLKIPVKGGEMIFSKIYNVEDIIDLNIYMALMPFVKLKNQEIDYIISVLDANFSPNSNRITTDFYFKSVKNEKEKKIKDVVRNNGAMPLLTSVKVEQSNIDVIQLMMGQYKASIVPILPEKSGNAEFKFAVDFGTTNTHIEYKVDGVGDDAKAFDHNKEIWKSLFDSSQSHTVEKIIIEDEEYFNKSLIPAVIGNKEVFFPLRTSLMWNKDISDSDKVYPYLHANNYMLLGINPRDIDFNIFTDIKWGGHNSKKIKSYIENLIHILYYKVIVNGGNPNKTKLTWFFPVSMGGAKDELEEIWYESFRSLFGTDRIDSRIISMPESIAPYFEYRTFTAGMSLSIDVGGGSADIAVFEGGQKNPHFISSFRFAGNAMFGDGYSNPEFVIRTDFSGFVSAFKNDAIKATEKSGKAKKGILDEILNGNQYSREFINFMFQLENDPNIDFSFTKLLREDKKYKINIFIYYAAVAYYSAVSMKNSGLKPPKNILFSGMGSKSVKIIDASRKLERIGKLFKFVFSKVYEEEFEFDMNVIMSENPKEITAKGGVKTSINDNIKIAVKLWSGEFEEALLDKEEDLKNTPTYNEAKTENQIIEKIEKSIKNFYGILDEFVDNIRLEDQYKISTETYDKFIEVRKNRDISDDMIKGIGAMDNKGRDKISETLFFYPIMELLNNLPRELNR